MTDMAAYPDYKKNLPTYSFHAFLILKYQIEVRGVDWSKQSNKEVPKKRYSNIFVADEAHPEYGNGAKVKSLSVCLVTGDLKMDAQCISSKVAK